MSNLTKEGHWAKALEVYEALDAVGVRPDTTITNAAISSCDKGGQWEAALALFRRMEEVGMARCEGGEGGMCCGVWGVLLEGGQVCVSGARREQGLG